MSAKEVPAPAPIIQWVGLLPPCRGVMLHGNVTFCCAPFPQVPCSFHPQLSRIPSATENKKMYTYRKGDLIIAIKTW